MVRIIIVNGNYDIDGLKFLLNLTKVVKIRHPLILSQSPNDLKHNKVTNVRFCQANMYLDFYQN